MVAGPSWPQFNPAAGGDMAFDPSVWIDDLAIVNADVVTLDPRQPRAEAVLVKKGRIEVVGSNTRVRLQGRGVRSLDARGRTVTPGFLDTHIHLEWSAAAQSFMEDFYGKPAKTIAEVLARLRKRAEATPPGQWVMGEGSIAGVVQEQRMPTMEEMDTVSQQHFVCLSDMFHAHTANTLATRAMGYLTSVDEANMRWWSNGQPVTGGSVARDAAGKPLGAYDLIMRLPRDIWSVQQLESAIRKFARYNFTEGGVTSATPMSVLSSNEYIADQALQASGELSLRLRTCYMVPFSASLDSVLQVGLARGSGNDMFRIGGFKFFVDGARAGGGEIVLSEQLQSGDRSAHAAAVASRQIQNYTRDQLEALIIKAQSAGFPTQSHCLSEAGAELVTDAVEDVRKLQAAEQLRHRVEHWKPRMELARRMRAAGVYFSLITTHPGLDPTWAQTPDTPYRLYFNNGIKPILVSDRCGGYAAPVRPLYSIVRACRTVDEGGEATVGNAVGFEDALKMWTLWAAESTHQEADRGSIAVGKLGDFALLSADVRKMAARDLPELQVSATVLGGKVIYRS
jgi:predicted amidohydrolase YtcJ